MLQPPRNQRAARRKRERAAGNGGATSGPAPDASCPAGPQAQQGRRQTSLPHRPDRRARGRERKQDTKQCNKYTSHALRRSRPPAPGLVSSRSLRSCRPIFQGPHRRRGRGGSSRGGGGGGAEKRRSSESCETGRTQGSTGYRVMDAQSSSDHVPGGGQGLGVRSHAGAVDRVTAERATSGPGSITRRGKRPTTQRLSRLDLRGRVNIVASAALGRHSHVDASNIHGGGGLTRARMAGPTFALARRRWGANMQRRAGDGLAGYHDRRAGPSGTRGRESTADAGGFRAARGGHGPLRGAA